MKELIFNIKEIFDSATQTGCLSQYEGKFFHIPAYQRGYKWASDDSGAVTKLLNDLKKAFDTDNQNEYYLQYITVKKIELPEGPALEVIDGQQRLTTLSIILSAFDPKYADENVAKGKLDYAVRDNFFSTNIYEAANFNSLTEKNWEDFITNPDYDKQDIYYLFSAAKKVSKFLKKEIKDVQSFYSFFTSRVKLIVNSVEPYVESEAVFKNLNSNKVPLTEGELIKALIITKIGRGKHKEKNFQEVTQIRNIIGRTWDEISTWSNRREINSFYFKNDLDPLHQLLFLTALIIKKKYRISETIGAKEKDFPLFNFYLNFGQPELVLKEMEFVKESLSDWFNNCKYYNLIGFLRFAKGSGYDTLDFLAELFDFTTKSALESHLLTKRKELLEKTPYSELSYEESPESIHHVLLALNVFIEGWRTFYRFNFLSFEKEKWTLEHIFPQTPEGKKNILKPMDVEAILELLEDECSDEVKYVLSLPERKPEEKEIYYKALREHPFLNSIGNMCLMTGKDNASNGNKFFLEKRNNILNLIQKGSFVPKHTFDVFSKMFQGANTAKMEVWSKKDMEQHSKHIKDNLELKIAPVMAATKFE